MLGLEIPFIKKINKSSSDWKEIDSFFSFGIQATLKVIGHEFHFCLKAYLGNKLQGSCALWTQAGKQQKLRLSENDDVVLLINWEVFQSYGNIKSTDFKWKNT